MSKWRIAANMKLNLPTFAWLNPRFWCWSYKPFLVHRFTLVISQTQSLAPPSYDLIPRRSSPPVREFAGCYSPQKSHMGPSRPQNVPTHGESEDAFPTGTRNLLRFWVCLKLGHPQVQFAHHLPNSNSQYIPFSEASFFGGFDASFCNFPISSYFSAFSQVVSRARDFELRSWALEWTQWMGIANSAWSASRTSAFRLSRSAVNIKGNYQCEWLFIVVKYHSATHIY